MSSSRETQRVLPTAASTILLIATLAGGADRVVGQDRPAAALKPPTAGQSDQQTSDEMYRVPDGSPEDILEFIEEIQEERPQFRTQQEVIQHVIRVQQSLIQAGEKLLTNKKVDQETAAEAADLQLQSYLLLIQIGLKGASDQARSTAEKLVRDPRPLVAEKARAALKTIDIVNAATLPAKDRAAVVRKTLGDVEASSYSRESLGPAFLLGEVLEAKEDTQPAADYFGQLSDLLAKSDNPELREAAMQLEGVVRRLQLPGNVMVVKGTTMDGAPFDLASYRGKVVLVDFWATWCPPCVQEIPNIKRLYSQYHAKGFEVVGITLDDNREQLEGFLKRSDIPWTTLFEPQPADRGPAGTPTALHYAIQKIPTAILVDQKGQVVSMNASGMQLAVLLEKLLGPPDEPADENVQPLKSTPKIREK